MNNLAVEGDRLRRQIQKRVKKLVPEAHRVTIAFEFRDYSNALSLFLWDSNTEIIAHLSNHESRNPRVLAKALADQWTKELASR